MTGVSVGGLFVALTAGETTVLTAAFLSGIGFLYRANGKRQDSQDSTLSEIKTDVAVVKSQSQDRDARLSAVERRVEETSGSVNALSLVVERMDAQRGYWDGRDRRNTPPRGQG